MASQASLRHRGQGQQPYNEGEELQSVSAPTRSASTMKTYNMYYTLSRLNVKLHLSPPGSSGPCTYFAESNIPTRRPKIQLRAGSSKSAPLVASATFHITSRHFQLGSRGYQRGPAAELVWEDMRREMNSFQRSDYVFGTSLASGAAPGARTAPGPRRAYHWKRDKEQVGKTIYRCVDDAGQVVARMRSGGMMNWKKGGEIDVARDLDKAFEEQLIVGALGVWVEEAGWSVNQGYESRSG